MDELEKKMKDLDGDYEIDLVETFLTDLPVDLR